MQPRDKAEAITGLIENFLIPAGEKFGEELVFRFLLTKGDALGGTMRNIGGALAQAKLNRAIISTLSLRTISYTWLHAPSNKWLKSNEVKIERQMRGISWNVNGKSETIIYNLRVPLVKNNVDLCLLHCESSNLARAIKEPSLLYFLVN